MIDDNKEDEYQFTELDGDSAFDDDISTEDVKTSFPSENNLRRIILSSVAVIIVGFILFKFLSSYFSTKGDLGDTNIATTSAQPVVAVIAKKSSTKPKILTPHTPPPLFKERIKPREYKPTVYIPRKVQPQSVKVVTETIADPKINEKLNVLRRSSQKSSRKISKINNNIGSLRDSIESLTSKIGSLKVTIIGLSERLVSQQTQLDNLKPTAKKEVVKKTVKPKLVTYHIKALIPGRGWLMSSKGETVTVIKGTALRGMGRVVSIDARHGKVTMSSGIVIQFTVSDT